MPPIVALAVIGAAGFVAMSIADHIHYGKNNEDPEPDERSHGPPGP